MTLPRRRRAVGTALTALGLLGCNAGFPPQWRVVDVRLLSTRAEVLGGVPATAPAADPDAGEPVRLTALVANPGAVPGATVSWKACLPQEGQVVSPCLDPALLRDPSQLDALPGAVDLGEGLAVTASVPAALAPLLAGLVSRAATVPELACTLYAELPVVAVLRVAGTTRLAVKTVRVTPWREVQGTSLDGAYVRNRNPVLGRVVADPADDNTCLGGPPVARRCVTDAECPGTSCRPDGLGGPAGQGTCADAMPAGRVTLCAAAAPDTQSQQVYGECRPDGSRVELFEGLTWQWYATGGLLERSDGAPVGDVGNITGQEVRFTRPDGPFTLWLIVRDGRGGEDWIRRDYP